MSVIEFVYVKWKNFLSTGNYFTEFHLNTHKTTLIHGPNGSGKSTLPDAINFVLFDSPLRDGGKDDVINSDAVRGEDTLVEIKFFINKDEYIVQRGRGGKGRRDQNFMKVIRNGEEISAPSKYTEYQKLFVNKILKMNNAIFLQQVLFGSNNWVPFMRLKETDKSKFIGHVLGLNAFTVAEEKNKTRRREIKNAINTSNQIIFDIEKEIAAKEATNEQIKKARENVDKEKKVKVAEWQSEVKEKRDRNEELQKTVDNFHLSEYEDLVDKLSFACATKSNLEKDIAKLEHKIEFYNNNHNCETCGRDIDDMFKEAAIAELKSNLETLNEKYQNAIEDKEKAIEEKNNQKLIKEEADRAQREIDINNGVINSIAKEIKRTLEELNRPKPKLEKVSDLKKDLVKEKKKNDDLINEKALVEEVATLLNNDVIKSAVIHKYIPMVEEIANDILSRMKFPGIIKFDKNFDGQIFMKSRKDPTPYGMLSGGQMMRIDIAILFTWAKVCRMITNISTNFMLFDEVLDSALDAEGIDKYIDLISEEADQRSFIIISHRADQIEDKFERVMEVKMINGYSHMIEN